jgi:hypothetical protein
VWGLGEVEGWRRVVSFGPLGYGKGVGDCLAGGKEDGWDGVSFCAGGGEGWRDGAGRWDVSWAFRFRGDGRDGHCFQRGFDVFVFEPGCFVGDLFVGEDEAG